MQYSIQGLNCDDPDLKDLLMDIGTEELSHLEVIGTLARMHLKPTKGRDAAEADPLIAICGGGGGPNGRPDAPLFHLYLWWERMESSDSFKNCRKASRKACD